MERILYFNFSKPPNVAEFMSLCYPEDIKWLSGHEVTRLTYNSVLSLHIAKTDFDVIKRLTLTQDSAGEFVRSGYYKIESTILDCYSALGIKTGDLFLDKPEAVRDIVRAFKDGEDVDAVVVKYLGDTVDNCNYPVVKD